jgi:hypothetical protein
MTSQIESNPKIEGPIEEEANDNGSVLVIILQCETKPCDKNIKNLLWVFSDPYFIVQVCAVDPPTGPPPSKILGAAHFKENHFMRKALDYASEGPYAPNAEGVLEPQRWWTDLPCLIVKDSSISHITPMGTIDVATGEREIGGMKRRIKTALEKAVDADLFFLCKWNDACSKFVDVAGGANLLRGTSLKWSLQPTATQAIMYRPQSRDYIRSTVGPSVVPLGDFLNLHIAEAKLKATVFVPNIIDYDIELATSNEDYLKANECQPLSALSEQTTPSNATYIWLVIIIIVMILLAWFVIQSDIVSAGYGSGR